MAKLLNRALQIAGESMVVGSPAITVELFDKVSMVRMAYGDTVPTNGDDGYAVGCLFTDLQGGVATTVYVNEGTTTNADFNVLGAAAAGASLALDNLSSVAINESLISDTDDTDDLGSAAKQWKDLFIDGTAKIDALEADLAEFGDSAGTDIIKIADNGVLTMENAATIDGVGAGNLLDKSASETITGQFDFTTAGVNILEDDLKLGLGASGNSDSYILFNGTSLMFFDTNVGSAKSLQDLLTGTSLNPNVNGDLTISDGKFDWTNAADETSTWSFAQTGAGSDIDITTALTTGECIHIIANSLTTGQVFDIETDSVDAAGTLIYLDITVAGHNATGNFIQCFDGSGDVFEVGKYGAVTIAGTSTGTDAITLTAGDITLTNGDVTLTDGDIILTANASKISATGTGANGMILKNLKNAAQSSLSGTQLDVEIDIGGTAYHFTVFPTKA